MKGYNDIEGNRLLTELTIFSTFLMGFIDSYTFIERGELFASAQTGNIIILVANLFEGHWMKAMVHVFTFLGFALGAFIGQGMIEHFKDRGWGKYRVYLSPQIILLLIIALIQQFIGNSLIGFLLGSLAGYELTVFRKFGSTNINNGIMTGNAKNLMNNLYKAIFNKDSEAKHEFLNLSMGIGLFMFGIGTGTLVLMVGSLYNLWVAFFITGLFYLWLEIRNHISKINKERGLTH